MSALNQIFANTCTANLATVFCTPFHYSPLFSDHVKEATKYLLDSFDFTLTLTSVHNDHFTVLTSCFQAFLHLRTSPATEKQTDVLARQFFKSFLGELGHNCGDSTRVSSGSDILKWASYCIADDIA